MSGWRYDLATIEVLWRRDLRRFLREPLRIIGALGQPLLFWLVIGAGLTETFRLPGTSVGYLSFFYAGVLVLVVLFTSIFASVGVIEDRQQGFLQAVLAAPGSRAAVIAGKVLATATIALMQAALFLLLLPAAGFPLASVSWGHLAATLILAAVGLSALGIGVAWRVRSVQSYHALQMTLLVPLWVVSGAMFPLPVTPAWVGMVARLNPVVYVVSSLRWALHGDGVASRLVATGSAALDLAIVALFAAVAVGLALLAVRRSPSA